MPLTKVGSAVSSAKRCRAGPPLDHLTPVPAIITGRWAVARVSTAAATSAGSGWTTGGVAVIGGMATSSSDAGPMSTSIGISRNAGPGTPATAWRTATSTYSGIRSVW